MRLPSSFAVIALACGVACGSSGEDGKPAQPASAGAGAASTGGAGGSGGAGMVGRGGSALLVGGRWAEIDESCEVDCAAQAATACPRAPGPLSCRDECLVPLGNLGNFCLDEYQAYVDCRVADGYRCTDGVLYPPPTCAEESVAYTDCVAFIGCKRYCETLLADGCASVSFDACFTACTDEQSLLPEVCAAQLQGIRFCQAILSDACAGDRLNMHEMCASGVISLGSCLSLVAMDRCVGLCWSAEELDCSTPACASDCGAKLADPSCGDEWDRVLDCQEDDTQCSASGLVPGDGCNSLVEAHRVCAGG